MQKILLLGLLPSFLGMTGIASAADSGTLIFECPKESPSEFEDKNFYVPILSKDGWVQSGELFTTKDPNGQTITVNPKTGRISGPAREVLCKRVEFMKISMETFAVNLLHDEDTGLDQVAMFNVVLKFNAPMLEEKLEKNMPRIHSKISKAVNRMTGSQLNTEKGKASLSKLIRNVANEAIGYAKGSSSKGVTDVSFQFFQIQ